MSVRHYRVYFLTSENHIYRFIELEVASDDDAARAAANLLQCDAVEVWHLGRKICRLDSVQAIDQRTGT